MKVSLRNYDIINKINVPDGVEIGSIPKGVGLERVRWDGQKLIDLFMLHSIWVEYINGAFILHCIEVPKSQSVTMEYKDRKKLWNDNGVYSIKTNEQAQNELNLKHRKAHYPLISDQMGAIMKYFALQTGLPEELQKAIDDIEAVKEKYPTTLTVARIE